MTPASKPLQDHHVHRRLGQADVDERWRYYEQLAGMERSIPHAPGDVVDPAGLAAEERERHP